MAVVVRGCRPKLAGELARHDCHTEVHGEMRPLMGYGFPAKTFAWQGKLLVDTVLVLDTARRCYVSVG